MGSGPAAGSVRARYLVFFQYLGTDFKYVPTSRARTQGERGSWSQRAAGARRGRELWDPHFRPLTAPPSLSAAGARLSGAPSAPSGSRTTWR